MASSMPLSSLSSSSICRSSAAFGAACREGGLDSALGKVGLALLDDSSHSPISLLADIGLDGAAVPEQADAGLEKLDSAMDGTAVEETGLYSACAGVSGGDTGSLPSDMSTFQKPWRTARPVKSDTNSAMNLSMMRP